MQENPLLVATGTGPWFRQLSYPPEALDFPLSRVFQGIPFLRQLTISSGLGWYLVGPLSWHRGDWFGVCVFVDALRC